MTLRPLADRDLERLLEDVTDPSVARWWDGADDRARVTQELREYPFPFAIEVDGELAGWLGIDEETDPWYRSAAIDMFLGPRFQDRGLGSEALRVAIDWLVGEREHHRVTIDPHVDNARAIRCYEAVGFRRVGVMEAYERRADGTFHDALYMELVRLPNR